MLCKQCNYRLWNLRSRECPECGTPFAPSEYEFIPNSVQFCCPHCNQSYFGTSVEGRLEPIEFDCVNCSQHIHMDEMVLLPTEGVTEEQTVVYRMPWLDRKEIGFFQAFFKTIGAALISPGVLIRNVPMDSPTSRALAFGILANVLLPCLLLVPLAVIGFVMSMGRPMVGFGVMLAFGILGGFAVATFATWLWILIWGAIAHGLLSTTGNTASGMNRTIQAIAYGAGANVVSAVPCLGAYFGWIWWVVSATIMVMEGQRVHGGRAALAVLTPPIAVLGSVGALYAWFIYLAVMSAPAPGVFSMSTMTAYPNETQTVLDSVLGYARTHDGKAPDHAIQLLERQLLVTGDLTAPSGRLPDKMKVGDTSLGEFAFQSAEERRAVMESVISSLPADCATHRLGDFLFTYHGIDLNDAHEGLWIVVAFPDPQGNPSAVRETFDVGFADGRVSRHPTDSWPKWLMSQNNLRSRLGLPQLPIVLGIDVPVPDVVPPEGDTP